MTQEDLKFVKENKEQVVSEIAELIENQLDGDILDLYFHLSGDKMNYGFQKAQNTIMMMCADSIRFVKDENDRQADKTAIEMELDLQIEQSEFQYE